MPNQHSKLSNWFIVPRPNPKALFRLFCFPYAGGSASTYILWQKCLPDYVELVAIQPPGRANRLFEKPYRRMEDMVNALYLEVISYLDKPYIFLGHSLGSYVSFELMRSLQKYRHRLPELYIASGSRAPHRLRTLPRKTVCELSEDEFVEKLKNFQGTPDVVLQNKDLLTLRLPMLKADFEVAETYNADINEKFDVSLLMFVGEGDTAISYDDSHAWQLHFKQQGEVCCFPGSHFFIEQNRSLVIRKINHVLDKQITLKR